MNENKNIPEWAWSFYQAKQQEASRCPNDANEEKLNYLVRIFSTDSVPESQARLDQIVDNHLAGERQKARRRQQILENAAATSTSSDNTHNERVSSSESLGIIRNSTTHSQWRLLTELASGNSYKQISAGRGLSTGTIKSSICRLRKRLRKLVFEDDSMSIAA
jgi:DNA-binding NarL/FixJ family response regulator